jgi:hypothetical protein
MEKEDIGFYPKTEEDIAREVEDVEKLIIENIRSIKYSEKENIPEDIKNIRRLYLENQQQLLLDRLDNLKSGE